MIISWLFWAAKLIIGFLFVICAINWYIQTNYGLTASQGKELKRVGRPWI